LAEQGIACSGIAVKTSKNKSNRMGPAPSPPTF
jgi:hypothetical protein